ncbi:MAG: NAD(P)/FAD-dependent oxidoreductase [Candidatus Micrarchaeia archaeon]
MPSQKDTKFDAIVVGAGPSGCCTAMFLARKKRKVLLIDKATFPRDKVCGDAVSGKSISVIRELGLLELLEKKEHGCVGGVKLVAPNSKEVVVPFPKAPGLDFAGYCLPRIQTDDILFQAVKKEKNICVLEGYQTTKLIKNENNVIGVETKKCNGEEQDKIQQYYAEVIVGADGVSSIVAREVGLLGIPPEHLYMGVRGYWNGVKGLSNNIELFFIDDVLPGYLWIFPMGGEKANVGLGILASDMKKRKKHPNSVLLDALRNSKMLNERFSSAKLEGNIGAWTIPLGSYKRENTGDGWLLVGDAASLVDPFSGEGYGNAATSGKIAAECIDEAIAQNPNAQNLTKTMLAKYSQEIDKLLRPEMETTYKLQRATRMKFLLNIFISKAASKPEFRKIIIDMLASNEEKKKVQDPLFYIKLLLP